MNDRLPTPALKRCRARTSPWSTDLKLILAYPLDGVLLCINHMALSMVVVLPSSTQGTSDQKGQSLQTWNGNPSESQHPSPIIYLRLFFQISRPGIGQSEKSPMEDQSHLPYHRVRPNLQTALSPAWKARLLLLQE